MAAYLVAVVAARWKGLPEFIEDQRQARWNQWAPEQPPVVGLPGAGEMGRRSAAAFGELECPVHGYSRCAGITRCGATRGYSSRPAAPASP